MSSERICIVKKGMPRFCVQVRPPQDAEYILPALTELMDHMSACLKTAPPWFDRLSENSPLLRLVVERRAAAALEWEEFEINASSDTIILRAATLPGLFHAVYYFLERAFGCRWLWPGPSGTVVPPAQNVFWPVGTEKHRPDWQWRRLWLGGAFYREDDPALAEMKKAGIQGSTFEELHLWQRRNHLGGVNIADGHRWAEICSPLEYGKQHPEYFALINGSRDTAYHDGKHKNQPCTSNPEVIELTANYVIAQFRSRPELDGFSISLNDGSGFCECESCREMDSRYARNTHKTDAFDRMTNEDGPPPLDAKVLSDRLMRFANEVADRVARRYPDKLLLFLVYSAYRDAPRDIAMKDNVMAQFCTSSWAHVTADVHDSEMRLLKKVAGTAQRLGIYDYLVNGSNGSVPRGCARVLHHCLQEYHSAGCRYYASQAGLDFSTGGFAYYVAARTDA